VPGESDLPKKRNRYSGEFKARVVFESISGDRSVEEIAEDYNIHPNQIKNWKSILKKRAEELFNDKRVVQQNR
jgi:transposase-like protein